MRGREHGETASHTSPRQACDPRATHRQIRWLNDVCRARQQYRGLASQNRRCHSLRFEASQRCPPRPPTDPRMHPRLASTVGHESVTGSKHSRAESVACFATRACMVTATRPDPPSNTTWGSCLYVSVANRPAAARFSVVLGGAAMTAAWRDVTNAVHSSSGSSSPATASAVRAAMGNTGHGHVMPRTQDVPGHNLCTALRTHSPLASASPH